MPSLVGALTSPHAFVAKAVAFGHALVMLATTMLGPVGFVLALVACFVPWRSRSDALLWGWLGGGLLYAYVVVTVERVDYYLYLLLAARRAARRAALRVRRRSLGRRARPPRDARRHRGLLWLVAALAGYREIAPYYRWSRVNFVRAKQLDATLAPGALVVMGHYDPSILYTIGRKGWEEDPHLWTPFDEQSAIRKGRTLLHRGRARALEADEPRAVLLALAFPGPRPERGVARVRDGSRQGAARRGGPLARVPPPRDGGRLRELAPRLEDGAGSVRLIPGRDGSRGSGITGAMNELSLVEDWYAYRQMLAARRDRLAALTQLLYDLLAQHFGSFANDPLAGDAPVGVASPTLGTIVLSCVTGKTVVFEANLRDDRIDVDTTLEVPRTRGLEPATRFSHVFDLTRPGESQEPEIVIQREQRSGGTPTQTSIAIGSFFLAVTKALLTRDIPSPARTA